MNAIDFFSAPLLPPAELERLSRSLLAAEGDPAAFIGQYVAERGMVLCIGLVEGRVVQWLAAAVPDEATAKRVAYSAKERFDLERAIREIAAAGEARAAVDAARH